MARILVVEDNLLNRLLVRDLLGLNGHEIAEAASVPEGRAALAAARFDLVVMDIHLPGGGGQTLLREIRADERLTRLLVVAVTALAMPSDRQALLGQGFDGYISKPIDTATFAGELESILEGARS
jgi:two-component system cell cycle response regulator DivK